jgi:arabinofuranan 3-O-arabinosyltransferase
MSDAVQSRSGAAKSNGCRPPLLGIFAAWRLRAYGCAFAVIYSVLLIHLYNGGVWLVDAEGIPIYTDFTCAWVAELLALHGQTALLYDPAEFLRIQASLAAVKASLYSTWPYPPTFFLVLAPFALLPYIAAFLSWEALTLIGCILVVYFIVRRHPAVALVLASPFTMWNFFAGQSGFLTAALFGAALIFVERRPVLAGVFIGCLTYKPHFGILIPVALAAAKQWRAFASAAATTAVLAVGSVAAFGAGVWVMFAQGLVAHTNGILLSDPDTGARNYWGMLQTLYGLIRYLDGGPALAWLAQAITTAGLALIVWLVWRSRVDYSLKAATLSAAALIATPYAFAYDLAAIVIPVAFLASEQIKGGFLRGEQTIMVVLFAASLSVIPSLGKIPVGLLIVITLLWLILRRAFFQRQYQDPIKFFKKFHLRRFPPPMIVEVPQRGGD